MSAEVNLTCLYLLVIFFICGLIAAWISKERGRSFMVGFALGMSFGFIGLLIAAILPANNEDLKDGLK